MGQMKWTQAVNYRSHFIWCHLVCQTSLILVLITRLANVVGWLCRHQVPAQFLACFHSCPSGMGKRCGRAKVRKFLGHNEDSLIGEGKLHVQAKQNKKFNHCLPPAGRCSFSHFLGNRTSAHIMGRQFGKTNTITMNIFVPSSFHEDVIWYGLSQLCPFPAYSLAVGKKAPSYAGIAQQ